MNDAIQRIGHRAYVGGDTAETWYGIGKLQYHFLIAQGLQPEHRFLDVACGALRLGQFLIPYLNRKNYFGLDSEKDLVEKGLQSELCHGMARLKQPQFAFNRNFDFSFVPTFDFAIAQSIFTHLVPSDIRLCLANLRSRAHEETVAYFTFFEGDSNSNPVGPSHPHKTWRYSPEQLAEIAEKTGWRFEYVGEWQHPRGQQMARLRP
jgi:SAM-dependent methyltransferase